MKLEQNYFEKVHRNEIMSKSEVQTALVFDIWTTFQKEMLKRQLFFFLSKTNQIEHLKFASVFHQTCLKNYIETTLIVLSIEIRLKKVHGNRIDFLLIKIMSKKVRWNIDFFSHWNCIEISTSKRRRFFAHWNYTEKSISKWRGHFLLNVST